MTAEHAVHGASSCKRWWNCPGSVALTSTMPDDSSPDAAEGTAAHALAALCLTEGQDALEYTGRVVEGHPVTAEMAEAVQVYIDHCRGIVAGTGPSCVQLVEHQFSLAPLAPPAPMFGTADFVATFGPWLWVVDLKFGRGVQVAAEGNPQLKYYALGAMLSAPGPVKYIRATIVQPRAPGGVAIRSVDLDPEELVGWSVELMDRVTATLQPDAPLNAGEWCRATFCKARGRCVAQRDAALAVAGVGFTVCDNCGAPPTVWCGCRERAPVTLPAPHTLTPEDKSHALHLLPLLEGWIKDLRASATADISHGAGVPGWKLVPTRPTQRWTDEAEAEAALDVLHELGEDRWAPREIVSPARARDILADRTPGRVKKDRVAAAKAALAPLITTASSGTNLVPDADARPAIPAGGAEFLMLEDK